MIDNDLLTRIADKNVNIDKYVEDVFNQDGLKKEIIKQLISNDNIMVYYHCYYIISNASEKRPELFYEYWDDFALLLNHKNSYHRDIGLTIIANLTKVDENDLFSKIFQDYMKHINDDKFMTARCFVQNTRKILKNKNGIIEHVVGFLLDVDNKCIYPEKQKELLKCDIIEVLDEVYQRIDDKKSIYQFIKIALRSISPKTKNKAKEFMKKYGL